jgi:hypothetical protein
MAFKKIGALNALTKRKSVCMNVDRPDSQNQGPDINSRPSAQFHQMFVELCIELTLVIRYISKLTQ